METLRDRELVNGILRNDREITRAFILKYQDLVLNTCFKILHNREDAEDIAQEVFLEALRSINTLHYDENLSFWIYRIALNKSINLYNRKKIARNLFRVESQTGSGSGEELAHKQDTGTTPESEFEQQEKLDILEKAIDSLPARQKKVLLLHKYENLSHKEICEILELSLSTVESLIFRAKANLRKALAKYYDQFFSS